MGAGLQESELSFMEGSGMPGTAKAIEVVTAVEKQPDGTIVVGKVTLLLKDDGAVSQVSEYVNWSKLGE